MTSTRHRRSTTTATREAAVRHRTGRKRKERKAQKKKKEKKKRQRRGTAATSHQPLTPSASVALKSVGSWLHMSVAEQGQYHHVGDSARPRSSTREEVAEGKSRGGSGGGAAHRCTHLGPENDRPRRLRVYTLRVVAGGTSAARAQAQTRKHHTHTEARAQGRTQHTQKHAHARYLSRRTHRLETFGTPLVC